MDRKIFFDCLRKCPLFPGGVKPLQVCGVEAVLDAWDKISPTSDMRFVAYSLATAYHETARKMQPIEEIGKGRGHAYGVKTGPFQQAYFGRGLVQLTWLANYQKADKILHEKSFLAQGQSLVKNPELALNPEIAGAIMIFGMVEGWFTGRKLGDYFIGPRSDWVDARRIINGTDRASLIASYGLMFLHALENASVKPSLAA